MVSIRDETEVPAQEAGVLASLIVVEGARVEQNALLGQIDDAERRIQQEIARAEQKSAAEQAENDINVRYADAANNVAEAEYLQTVEANKKVAGAIPLPEVRRLKLAWHRAFLQIKQAALEQHVMGFTAQAKSGEVKLAEANIERHRIVSPIAGEVMECYNHVGEWVHPGDSVLRIARLDVLRVEGFIAAADFDPAEIADRPVTVSIEMARGRTVQMTGQVVYVSPVIESGKMYRLWADVANRQENNHWLLRPGQSATMTIHLGGAVPTETTAAAAVPNTP